jgi:O-antigen ligase
VAETERKLPERAFSEPRTDLTHLRPGRWEMPVLIHVSVLVVGLSWSFGGQIAWARDALLAWGTLGMILFFLVRAHASPQEDRRVVAPVTLLWPLVLFDLLVLASCLNPSTRPATLAGEQVLLHVAPAWPWLPSSAQPGLSFRELWQFNAIILSAFNVFQGLLRRSMVRRLLVVIVANGLALAVFGTFQKLQNAEGIWFGLVKSPNPFFFATFVYHNHWGAFTMLNIAAGLGLLFHAWRRGGHRDFWHSPVLMGGVGLLFLAAAVPLSGSRSSTALAALILLGALVHVLVRLLRQRRERHESAMLPVSGIVLAALIATTGIVLLARDVITHRARDSVRQLDEIQSEVSLNARLRLYGDTWRMASERPVFGWGLESYGHVFMVYNSAPTPLRGGWKPYYEEAHNDWLQALAEVGFAGTALIGLLVLLPLRGLRWSRLESHIPRYLLLGCGVLLLYAWVEFPFANPSVMTGFWVSLYAAARYARLDLGDTAK